jgi:3'(2'), 5'-bisphosphate nucleotidase
VTRPGAIAAPAPGLLDELTTTVSHAAGAILAIRAGALKARIKPDRSPVTAADDAAEAVILEAVSRLLPGVPIVSEEASGQTARQPINGDFVLVDPLDGTRELLEGRDEFTVNVALISGGKPILGIVAAPALHLIWRATVDAGAERLALAPGAPASQATDRAVIHCRPWPKGNPIAAVSRSHLDADTVALVARIPGMQRVAWGSALKFCRVAEGSADLYPRLAPTCEWDVAAGHAVVRAAGGIVTRPDGEELSYGGAKPFRIASFIVWGDPAAARRYAPES